MKLQKGFEIVELLIIVAILCILAVVIVPNVLGLMGRDDAEGNSTEPTSAEDGYMTISGSGVAWGNATVTCVETFLSDRVIIMVHPTWPPGNGTVDYVVERVETYLAVVPAEDQREAMDKAKGNVTWYIHSSSWQARMGTEDSRYEMLWPSHSAPEQTVPEG